MEVISRYFKCEENGTTVRREVVAGATTFATMSYIVFVQPAVLEAAGMDFGAVMVATCVSSAVATLIMGLFARYPIALAPAMGHNFFFVYTVVLAMGIEWQTALGAVFISGAAFIVLSVFGVREAILESVPASLKNAIAAGIGLLIALVGLEWAGVVVSSPGTYVGLGDLKSAPVLLSLFGLVVVGSLMALRLKSAMLIGIAATAVVGLVFGVIEFKGVLSVPPSIEPTFLKLDIAGAFGEGILTVIFVFFFLDLFDTIGTLIGVGEEGGFIKDGRLPRARRAFLADAVGTVTGSLLGTSTVTSYIESSTGVAAGARTGLASVVTAALFISALFFAPIVEMVGGGYRLLGGVTLYPVIAPALIVVGSLMLKCTKRIKWDDPSESIPAFLTAVVMPFTFSITEGIAFGFISYTLLKLVSGRSSEVSPLLYVFSGLFILRYVFLV